MSDKLEALSRLNFEKWMEGDYSPDRSPGATSTGEDAFKSVMWHIYSSAQLPLLVALEEKDQEMNKTKDHLQDVERVRDAFAAEAHHLSAIAKQLPSAERRVGELLLRAEAAEQRLQQLIKLPKREIGMACEFVSDHIVVSLAAVLAEAAMAGFKAEVEGE